MKRILLFVLLTIFLLLSPKLVFAEEIIRSFDSYIQANKDGSLDVVENIVFDYGNPTEERHGIFRQLPKVVKVGDLYRVMDFKIKEVIRDGNPETFTDKSDNKEFYIVVGHPDRHIKGVHSFQISYTVLNGIGSNYDDHDEIYWSVTGNNWGFPIEKASATLASPVKSDLRKTCYTGRYGSDGSNCIFATLGDNSIVQTTKPLSPYEGLSAIWEFPKGTFPPSTLQYNDPASVASPLNPVVKTIFTIVFIAVPLILNLIIAPLILIWYFKTRRKERLGSPSVNFDFPEDEKGKRITPAEAGAIDNTKLDQNDVIGTIFDFAIRKLIKIEQDGNNKDDYKFLKLKELDEGNDFEKTLWNKLFDNNESTKLSSFEKDFYQTFNSLQTKIWKILIERKFYSENPSFKKGAVFAGAVLSFITLNPLLAGALVFIYFKYNGRTAKGTEADWKLDGLKIFLKNMKRHHSYQAMNLITVEKYIPYAIAFGFINEFMDELKLIYPDYKPNWYSGNIAFYSISSSMVSSMNSNFTTHAPSSSSGFSGGGFSGGGSGGGGGGSW